MSVCILGGWERVAIRVVAMRRCGPFFIWKRIEFEIR